MSRYYVLLHYGLLGALVLLDAVMVWLMVDIDRQRRRMNAHLKHLRAELERTIKAHNGFLEYAEEIAKRLGYKRPEPPSARVN